jgi:hypothetical protein
MPKRRTALNVHNFKQVVHNPQGTHLFGELLQDHHQGDLEVIPAHSRLYVLGRRADEALVIFAHGTIKELDKTWSDGIMRVVKWDNIQVMGRFNRGSFTGSLNKPCPAI